MKRHLTNRILLALTLGVVLGLGLAAVQFRANRSLTSPRVRNEQGTSSEEVTVVREQFALYEELTRQAMMSQADAIFVGQVVNISPTSWNQDSGDYWEGGLQVHTIEFEVISAIVDEVGLGSRVALTFLGQSPVEGNADHQLGTGDRAIIFAEKRDLVWADGKKPVYTLLGVPTDSYFKEQDGLYYGRLDERPMTLDELTSEIVRNRVPEVGP